MYKRKEERIEIIKSIIGIQLKFKKRYCVIKIQDRIAIFYCVHRITVVTLWHVYQIYLIMVRVTCQDTACPVSLFLVVSLLVIVWGCTHGWFFISDIVKRTLSGASSFVIVCLQASETISSRGNITCFCTC